MTTTGPGGMPPRGSVSTADEVLRHTQTGLVLSTVLAEGPLARAEVADRIGLTRATVTRVVARLLEQNLLRERSPRRDSPGRPMVPLEIAGEDRGVITVHFGAHESRVGLVDLRGRVLDEMRDRYVSTDPETLVGGVSARVSAISIRHANRLRVLGVGVGIGGWLEPESGEVIRFEPLGWQNVPLGALLSAAIPLPVYLDQFVRGLAMAEQMFGTARGQSDFVEMWIGNVVGAAIVQGGVVRRGPKGASGVIAHFPTRDGEDVRCECGRRGCLGKRISDDAVLAEAVRLEICDDRANIRDVVDLARQGEPHVMALLASTGSIAGSAAAAMADLINPSAWVVGGVVTTAPEFLDSFRRTFEERAERSDGVTITASQFGDLAPTIASASVILDRYYRDPMALERR